MNASEWKLGLSTCATHSVDKSVFESYARNSIEVMEISLPTEMYNSIRWHDVKRYSDDNSVHIRSIHLPYYPFETLDLSDPDSTIRKNAIDKQIELMKRAAEIGVSIAVIHPSGEPYNAAERSDRLAFAKDSLAVLAEYAKSFETVVAVENLPRTCLGSTIEEMRYLVSEHGDLRICFDTNHLLKQKNSDFIKALGHLFVTIHVSDYDFVDEKHWLPYEGKTDWIDLVTQLENVGYEGPFLYEVPRTKPKALDRRELTFADYKQNFDACIKKKHPPVIK